MENKNVKPLVTKVFEKDVLANTIRFLKFCRLNLLYLKRIRKYDLSVLSALNKINRKLFVDWVEVLPGDARVILLNMSLDPKSVNFTRPYPSVMRFDGRVKYNIEEGPIFRRIPPNSLVTEINKLELRLKDLKRLQALQDRSEKGFKPESPVAFKIATDVERTALLDSIVKELMY